MEAEGLITGFGDNKNGTAVPQCVEWAIHCLWNSLSTVCGMDYPVVVDKTLVRDVMLPHKRGNMRYNKVLEGFGNRILRRSDHFFADK